MGNCPTHLLCDDNSKINDATTATGDNNVFVDAAADSTVKKKLPPKKRKFQEELQHSDEEDSL